MNGRDCANNTQRNQSDCHVYTSVQTLMAKFVTKCLELVYNGHWPVGDRRLIAGYQSISDQSYRIVCLGCVSQDSAMSGPLLIVLLQIYGYVSSICTKVKTLLSLLASVIDFLQMWKDISNVSFPHSQMLSFCDWHHCYFIHLTDSDLLSTLPTQWATFIDKGCSGALNTAHADIAVFMGREQITGLLFPTIQLISSTRCPDCHAQLEPGSRPS